MKKPFHWYWKHWRTRPNKKPGLYRWIFYINKTKLLQQENLSDFPIELSCNKFILFLLGLLWAFFIYIGFTDFEGFLEIFPLSIAVITFFGYGTVSIWKMVHTTITAEQNYFVVKSGKHKKNKYLYSDVTKIAYTNSKSETTYSVYVGNKKVVVFNTEFKNHNEFLEILKSQDVVIETYPKLLLKRILKKISRK